MPDVAPQRADPKVAYMPGRWHPVVLVLGLGFSTLLMASFFLEPGSSLWLALDERLFWTLNRTLLWGPWYQELIAVATSPFVDIAGGLSMLGLYLHFAAHRGHTDTTEVTAICLLLLLLILVAVQIAKAIPYDRPSGTLVFTDALRLNGLVTWIHSKDSSRDTFPGDHGTVLLVFAGLTSIYLPRAYAAAAWLLVLIFIFPRLVSGAHWLSDVAVGSVSIAGVVLTATFATPLHRFLLDRLACMARRLHRRPWLPRGA